MTLNLYLFWLSTGKYIRCNMMIKIAIILLITQLIDAKHNKTSCFDILRELANFESKFAYCITTNSVPVKMCTNCKNEFDSVNETYVKLRNNKTCETMYFDKDRVNLVASTEAALNGIWTKAYCDGCSENTRAEFDNRSSTFDTCLNLNKNESCTHCILQYQALNHFYSTLDEHNNGKVCFDIQDSMNRTRNTWSKDLKCCPREFRMTLFTVALCIVTCLPFLFYGGTYFVTKRQERNHGILNDEDPLFSQPAPSSSNAIGNPNIRSEDVPSSSTQRMSRPTEPTKKNKGFITLDEESDEESDEENLAIKNKLQ